jgi:BTB/POZ domain-containing protein 3/6
MDYAMNEDKSDITLIIDGHRIPANRVILGVKSPVFDRIFFGNGKESNEKEIEIKDASIDSFKVMLKWIYCQELHLNEQNDYLMAINVFKLSHRFELKKLMTTIEQKLIQMISIENIEVLTEFASFYDLKQLIKICEHFIENNPKLLIEKDIDLCFNNKLLKFMANEYKKCLI